MLDKLYFTNAHLTSLAFLMLENNCMDANERRLILSHVTTCGSCMKAYLASISEEELLTPSTGLENRVLERIRVEKNSKRSAKILIMQGTKLAIAVCLTMVIFFGVTFNITSLQSQRIESSQDFKQSQAVADSHSKPPKKSFITNVFDGFNQGFLSFTDIINNGFKGVAKNGAE